MSLKLDSHLSGAADPSVLDCIQNIHIYMYGGLVVSLPVSSCATHEGRPCMEFSDGYEPACHFQRSRRLVLRSGENKIK